ncbi:MAG: prolyl oligopeptidase family serine peptidase [Fimbriiglobus sp.]|jgi:polyhydroxybutyrate depolymerase|nr:prolyl oligopeptidase family serine peptidase [Fimbriiglobus sp.]
MFAFPLLAFAFAADPEPKTQEFTVGGLKREALVYAPAKPGKKVPVVFAFHGHGGTAKNAARSFALQTHWQEAIVVYPQGLPTPGRLTDPDGKKNGWQATAGDQGDRDLKFFDEMLTWLKKDHLVDEKRVYATGHSNGGSFTYLLWQQRGDVFAAVAPSAAAGKNAKDLKPKPCLHVAGESDELVKYEWQKATMATVRKTNGCVETGKEWEKAGKLVGTVYESKGGTPFVSLIGPGGHQFPADAPKLIVKFFQQHEKQ